MSQHDKAEPMPTCRRYRIVRELIAGEGVSEEVAKEFEDLQAFAGERLDDLKSPNWPSWL
jgi:hypothetical protein